MFLKSFPPIKLRDNKVPNVKSSVPVPGGRHLSVLPQNKKHKPEQLWSQSSVMSDRKSTF